MTITPQKTTFNGSLYREHLILYMDILGYSDVMLYGEEEKKQAIIKLQDEFRDSNKNGYVDSSQKGSQTKTKIKPLTTLLSDTLIFSFPLTELQDSDHLFTIASAFSWIGRKITRAHRIFLENGMLIRGSVVIGKIVNHNGMAYGEGLAKASASEKGKLPFIYFNNEIIQYIENCPEGIELNGCLFNCENIETKCFNWLEAMWTSSLHDEARPKLFACINKQVQQINENLVATQSNDNAHQKWLTVAKYFDTTIKERNAPYITYLLKESDPSWIYRGEQIRFP